MYHLHNLGYNGFQTYLNKSAVNAQFKIDTCNYYLQSYSVWHGLFGNSISPTENKLLSVYFYLRYINSTHVRWYLSSAKVNMISNFLPVVIQCKQTLNNISTIFLLLWFISFHFRWIFEIVFRVFVCKCYQVRKTKATYRFTTIQIQ